MRYVARTLALSYLLIAVACTKAPEGGSQNTSGTPTASAPAAFFEKEVPASVVNTSCYYAPLPGAFRMYCPGPKNDTDGCQAIPGNLEVSFEAAGAKQTTVARALTSSENHALPEGCLSFDLNLLPNSDHKLSYRIGRKEYHVFNYLAFGDGSVP